jgi:hypothetical protein
MSAIDDYAVYAASIEQRKVVRAVLAEVARIKSPEPREPGDARLTLQQVLDSNFEVEEFTEAGLVHLAALAIHEATEVRALSPRRTEGT